MIHRRVAALVLPDLACELAFEPGDAKDLPLAVVDSADSTRETSSLVLWAVNRVAHRFGIRPGQTVAEARALVSSVVVRGITLESFRDALGRIAEVMLAFGTTASIEAKGSAIPLGVVWVDITGTAHLRGGEEAALLEMTARASDLGHRVRAAIASGPRLARAVAAFGAKAETVVSAEQSRASMQGFPLDALPLSRDRIVWLNRLGIWTVGDLARLPISSFASRLGDRASYVAGERWREALDLADGRDDTPLVPYEPPRAPTESVEWEEPVLSIEPLLFALRGLVSRLAARLEGRGEAAEAIELVSLYDPSIARLRRLNGDPPALSFRIDLPAPLGKKAELFRVLKSRLEAEKL
ncbi:MAG TPA: DNA polymerase Y family protein, partial [Polyangiaceae bacterium]|nr:DNA polymerase Y family protein [Polyangiaceae bacterium]